MISADSTDAVLNHVLRHFSDGRMTDGERPAPASLYRLFTIARSTPLKSARTLAACDARGQHFRYSSPCASPLTAGTETKTNENNPQTSARLHGVFPAHA